MAHKHQLDFVRTVAEHLAESWNAKDILEIGSFDVNGSIRPFFKESKYIGVDLTTGPGVDVVCDGAKVAYPDESFDLCTSCECFEHNPKWFETFQNMYRMTRKGGALLFTCASTGRLEHGTTRTTPDVSPGTQSVGWDYYMNLTQKDFTQKIDFANLFSGYLFIYNKFSCDLYFIGIKSGAPSSFRFERQRLEKNCLDVALATRAEEKMEYPYSPVIRFVAALSRLPARAAALLPEKHFQNFAVCYFKALESLKRPVRKIIQ
jgi:SAM-dependent methyltransferase